MNRPYEVSQLNCIACWTCGCPPSRRRSRAAKGFSPTNRWLHALVDESARRVTNMCRLHQIMFCLYVRGKQSCRRGSGCDQLIRCLRSGGLGFEGVLKSTASQAVAGWLWLYNVCFQYSRRTHTHATNTSSCREEVVGE